MEAKTFDDVQRAAIVAKTMLTKLESFWKKRDPEESAHWIKNGIEIRREALTAIVQAEASIAGDLVTVNNTRQWIKQTELDILAGK